MLKKIQETDKQDPGMLSESELSAHSDDRDSLTELEEVAEVKPAKIKLLKKKDENEEEKKSAEKNKQPKSKSTKQWSTGKFNVEQLRTEDGAELKNQREEKKKQKKLRKEQREQAYLDRQALKAIKEQNLN